MAKSLNDIDRNLDTVTRSAEELANLLASTKADIFETLNRNSPAVNVTDIGVLQGLITKLNGRRTELETGLGSVSGLDFLDDSGVLKDVGDLYRSVSANIDMSNCKDTPLRNQIDALLKSLQHWDKKDKSKTLFHKSIENSQDLVRNMDLLADPSESARITGDYLTVEGSKLFDDAQRNLATRLMYILYNVVRITYDQNYDSTKETKLRSIFNAIKDDIAPRLKGLYNVKRSLDKTKFLESYLADLDAVKGDFPSETAGYGSTVNVDLKEFFHGNVTNIDHFILTKISDDKGHRFSLRTTVNTPTDLKSDTGESNSVILGMEIGGDFVPIGSLELLNTANPVLNVQFKSEAEIVAAFNAIGVDVTNHLPINLNISITGEKEVRETPHFLGGSMCSLTKDVPIAFSTAAVPPRGGGGGGGGPLPGPRPVPGPRPGPTLIEDKEVVSTVSNVAQVNRALLQVEADEKLRKMAQTPWYNLPQKLYLFFGRKFIKDNYINKRMKGIGTMDWSDASQAAADRHQIEKRANLTEGMNVVLDDIDDANYPETRRRLDNLVNGFLSEPPTVDEDHFKTGFQSILEMSGVHYDDVPPPHARPGWIPMSEIIKSNNITQISTNVLMQVNKFKEHKQLAGKILDHIYNNTTEPDDVFDTYCRGEIKSYIEKYNDIPDFLKEMGITLDTQDAMKDLRDYERNHFTLTNIAAKTLKLKVQILNGGGEAYNVKKQGGFMEKAGRFLDDPTGGEHTKVGRYLNKHPVGKNVVGVAWGVTKLAAMTIPAIFLAPYGPLAIASWAGGASGVMTLFKKKAHFEREHRSYQRLQARNLTEYRDLRSKLAREVAGMRRYEGRFWGENARKRSQYRNIIRTTQDQLSLTKDLLRSIEDSLQKASLTPTEQTNFAADLADALARLDYHKKTGQNFLGSNSDQDPEAEYRNLQNAVVGGVNRLGITVDDLRGRDPYDNYYRSTISVIEKGNGDTYDKQGYLKARKRFKNRSNLKSFDSAFKAGAISFGLSCLASYLAGRFTSNASGNGQKLHYGPDESGKLNGGEFHLGDYKEDSLLNGDIDNPMRSLINEHTKKITSAQLYSSVDAAEITYEKSVQKLNGAWEALGKAFQDPAVADNSSLIKAVRSYLNEANTKIGEIPGLSAGNKNLNFARAIEDVRAGILDPIIKSGNANIQVSSDALHWVNGINGGAQVTGTGVVDQAFRNMGVLNLDVVQAGNEVVHATRAFPIPIPVGFNDFGQDKEDMAMAA